MQSRGQYLNDEAAVRGAWCASVGANGEEEIRSRSLCAPAVAYRVACLRRGGALRTLTLWLEGALTLRQVERIVSGAPFDEERQVRDAALASLAVRASLGRE